MTNLVSTGTGYKNLTAVLSCTAKEKKTVIQGSMQLFTYLKKFWVQKQNKKFKLF